MGEYYKPGMEYRKAIIFTQVYYIPILSERHLSISRLIKQFNAARHQNAMNRHVAGYNNV
jgi:hypothetical protein